MRKRFWSSLCAVIFFAHTTLAEPPPLAPAEFFGALPFIDDPVLSPDGTKLVVNANVDGESSAVIINLSDRSQRPKAIGATAWDVRWLRWVNNERMLVSIGTQVDFEGQKIYITRVFGINADGTNFKMLGRQKSTQFADDLVYVPPLGGTSILMSLSSEIGMPPDVQNVDVVTGKMSRVIKGKTNVREWFADVDGVVRLGVAYSRERNLRTLYYRKAEGEDFRSIAKNNLSDAKDEGADGFIRPLAFTAEPNTVIIKSLTNKGRDGLYEYNLEDQKRGKEIFAHDIFDVGDAILSADGKRVIGASYIDDKPNVMWLDEDRKALQKIIEADTPHDVSSTIVTMSADQNRMIIRREGPTTPPVFYFMDARDRQLQLIGKSQERLDESMLAPMKPVNIIARDKLPMRSYLTLPLGRDVKNLPLILMPHGGPWARDYLRYDYWVQFLANRGYAVLQPNFRGSTGFGLVFTARGFGNLGKEMQDDLEDAVNWAVNEGIADPKRVCIMGGSYGGYAAMMGLAKTPDLYRCAISFAGVSNVPALIRYDRNAFLYGKLSRRAFGGEGDSSEISPINLIDRITAPLLLVHGKEDLRVPVSQSVDMASALKRAGKSVELITQPDGNHGLSREVDRIAFLKAVDAFLAKHNPA